MSAQSNAPIIIKRVKKVSGGGHHGGAWKVAYADFVTAMMAFFMLMWLLNATTEKQRKGIADYFSPTIPLTRASGGGNGAFGGDSVFVQETLAQTGHGGVPSPSRGESSGTPSRAAAGEAVEAQVLEELEQILNGNSGESMVSDLAGRHVVSELSDEGLIIEVFDIEREPLFEADSDVPRPVLTELINMLVEVFALVRNEVAIEGHVAAQPVVLAEYTGWNISGARASRVRALLGEGGLAPERINRVTGYADRSPVARNPMAVRNNRIVLILLRTKR